MVWRLGGSKNYMTSFRQALHAKWCLVSFTKDIDLRLRLLGSLTSFQNHRNSPISATGSDPTEMSICSNLSMYKQRETTQCPH